MPRSRPEQAAIEQDDLPERAPGRPIRPKPELRARSRAQAQPGDTARDERRRGSDPGLPEPAATGGACPRGADGPKDRVLAGPATRSRAVLLPAPSNAISRGPLSIRARTYTRQPSLGPNLRPRRANSPNQFRSRGDPVKEFTAAAECAKLPVILDARPRALVACPGSRPFAVSVSSLPPGTPCGSSSVSCLPSPW
jgi:hypothetical protein